MKRKQILIIIIPVLIISGSLLIFQLKGRFLIPIETISEENSPVKPEKTPLETITEPPPIEPNEATSVPETPDSEIGPKKLIDIRINDVLSVEYIYGKEKLLIEKSGTQWSVNKGLLGRIDYDTVLSSLNETLEIKSVETVSFSAEVENQWGIDESSRKVLIKSDNNIQTLLLGSPNQEGTGYYLQLKETGEVFLVKNSAGDALKLNLDKIRNRALVLFDISQVETMSIRNEREISIVPYKRSDMFTDDVFDYMLESPYRAYIPVNKEKFSQFLHSMKSPLMIVDFIDEGNPEDYGINDRSPGLRVKEKNGSLFELLTGGEAGQSRVYGKLKNEKQIFTLYKENLYFLDIQPFYLVDRTPHRIAGEIIDTFMITTDELAVIGEIEKQGEPDRYTVNGIEIEEKVFINLFEIIQNLAMEGEATNPVNTDKAQIILSYKLYDGGSLWTHLNFYPYNSNSFAVGRNEDDPLFIISRNQVKSMLDKVTETVDELMGF